MGRAGILVGDGGFVSGKLLDEGLGNLIEEFEDF